METANFLLASVAELEVEIHYDCGTCEPAPRSVKRADFEDTDGEDERGAEAVVGGKVVSEYAPESSGPRARMGIAAGGKGVSWHAPESGDSRAPSTPSGVHTASRALRELPSAPLPRFPLGDAYGLSSRGRRPNAREFGEMSEYVYVSSLERLQSESRCAAEKRCRGNDATID